MLNIVVLDLSCTLESTGRRLKTPMFRSHPGSIISEFEEVEPKHQSFLSLTPIRRFHS